MSTVTTSAACGLWPGYACTTPQQIAQVVFGTRYGAHCVTVGEDEQAGGVRRHDDHDQDSPRNRCLAEAMSVIMVTVAVGRDLLGQNRFQTV